MCKMFHKGTSQLPSGVVQQYVSENLQPWPFVYTWQWVVPNVKSKKTKGRKHWLLFKTTIVTIARCPCTKKTLMAALVAVHPYAIACKR